jgi:hypothetical protein
VNAVFLIQSISIKDMNEEGRGPSRKKHTGEGTGGTPDREPLHWMSRANDERLNNFHVKVRTHGENSREVEDELEAELEVE